MAQTFFEKLAFIFRVFTVLVPVPADHGGRQERRARPHRRPRQVDVVEGRHFKRRRRRRSKKVFDRSADAQGQRRPYNFDANESSD